MEIEPEKFWPQYEVCKICRVGVVKLGLVGLPETTDLLGLILVGWFSKF